jgi:hypothetical protein
VMTFDHAFVWVAPLGMATLILLIAYLLDRRAKHGDDD